MRIKEAVNEDVNVMFHFVGSLGSRVKPDLKGIGTGLSHPVPCS